MGEIADDMTTGLSCSSCGVYFTAEHGFPVLCGECWEDWTSRERQQSGVKLATHPEAGAEIPDDDSPPS